MIPVLNSAANVTAYIQRRSEGSGWGGIVTWDVIEAQRGRVHALSGTERLQAQSVERDSTHRVYLDATNAAEDDRVVIEDGPYRGVYLIRFVDYREAPGMKFYQVDINYLGARQEDLPS